MYTYISGNPYYSAKKKINKKTSTFLHNLFLKNEMLLGKLFLLCNMVEIICFSFQYLSKTARKSFENIERLAIVYKFIFRRCHIMQLRLELISVMKFNTSASSRG